MNKGIINLLFFIVICFVAFLIFRNINFREGLENGATTTSDGNGYAGLAQNYSADIKSQSIKNQDVLLVTKYRADYENVVINLDELIDTLMLQTALSVDLSNPLMNLNKLASLNSAKSALNNVMKYIDSTN